MEFSLWHGIRCCSIIIALNNYSRVGWPIYPISVRSICVCVCVLTFQYFLLWHIHVYSTRSKLARYQKQISFIFPAAECVFFSFVLHCSMWPVSILCTANINLVLILFLRFVQSNHVQWFNFSFPFFSSDSLVHSNNNAKCIYGNAQHCYRACTMVNVSDIRWTSKRKLFTGILTGRKRHTANEKEWETRHSRTLGKIKYTLILKSMIHELKHPINCRICDFLFDFCFCKFVKQNVHLFWSHTKRAPCSMRIGVSSSVHSLITGRKFNSRIFFQFFFEMANINGG